MEKFIFKHINPVKLNLFFDSLKSSLGVLISLCISLWLTSDYQYHIFSFIFSSQLVYAKTGISLKKRASYTLFWASCLGIFLATIPLFTAFIYFKSALLVLIIYLAFYLKDKSQLFDNNLTNQFLLNLCVYFFLLSPGKADFHYLFLSLISGIISISTDILILKSKNLRNIKYLFLRVFLRIPVSLKKIVKSTDKNNNKQNKEDFFYYIEIITEIENLEETLKADTKQKKFYTKLIFFTATAFRALKIIEFNFSDCLPEFKKNIKSTIDPFALAYKNLAYKIFSKKIEINHQELNSRCLELKNFYLTTPNQHQCKILVSLERLASLAKEIDDCITYEN